MTGGDLRQLALDALDAIVVLLELLDLQLDRQLLRRRQRHFFEPRQPLFVHNPRGATSAQLRSAERIWFLQATRRASSF